MVRQVTVFFPRVYTDQINEVIQRITGKYIHQIVRHVYEDGVEISFKMRNKHLQYVLDEIGSTGCGELFGHIDVSTVLLSRPPIAVLGQAPPPNKKRQYRISERMTVDEIYMFIDDGNHLTFNYMMLLFIASTIAGTGLLVDSSTTVIAAVLLSPLMGPILSITFGLAINDYATIQKGTRNGTVGVCIALLVGIVIGIIGGFIYDSNHRSDEITSRGDPFNLIGGFVIAVCSGMAVVLGVTTGGASALIGTSISAALLAPLVNAAVCLGLSFTYHFFQNSQHDAREYVKWSSISFLSFILSLSMIVIVGAMTFRYIKDVKPEYRRHFSQSFDLGPIVPNNSFALSEFRKSQQVNNILHKDMHHARESDNDLEYKTDHSDMV